MKVSVVIPCYNGEAFIAEAVRSALAQSGEIECLVVDDASSDSSREIILALARQDGRVKPLLLDENGGPSVARNRGLDEADGDWIALLDADDYYRPDRLEKLLQVAEACQADIVIDNISRFHPDGRLEESAFKFLTGAKACIIPLAEFCRLNIATGWGLSIGFSKPIFRREFLSRHALRLNPQYRVGEDYLLLAECLMRGARLAATPYCGYVYRVVPSSLSRTLRLADLKGLCEIHDRLLTYPAAREGSVRRHLSAQKRNVRRYTELRKLKRLLKRGRYFPALKVLAGHPGIGLLAMPMLQRRVLRLFGRTAHV
ncbi:MAG TPA: glycosyltransferase family 2 protein [Rhizomicrobium sp.]|nr:glycosyltransferase family 2 protein [Rhizomicrobium sp.]